MFSHLQFRFDMPACLQCAKSEWVDQPGVFRPAVYQLTELSTLFCPGGISVIHAAGLTLGLLNSTNYW